MSYLLREDEKTLGELQRDIEAVKAATRAEQKKELVLEFLVKKKEEAIDRFMRLFAIDAQSEDEKQAVVGLLRDVPSVMPLDPKVPFRPFVVAMATGRLASVKTIDASNNLKVDDDSVVALGHIIGACEHATNLECVALGGTAVRCRGLSSLIEGAVRRREKHGIHTAPLTIQAYNTEADSDPPATISALRDLIQSTHLQYPNIMVEM